MDASSDVRVRDFFICLRPPGLIVPCAKYVHIERLRTYTYADLEVIIKEGT